jgi:hypothetical protein
MTFDWQAYVTSLAEETVAIAARVLEVTSEAGLRIEETDALLVELEGGAEGFTQLLTAMQSQQSQHDFESLIRSIHVVWLQMIDVVQRFRDLAETEHGQSHLRLVVSNTT